VDLPYIVIAYDSEKDNISKIRNLFPFLRPNGGTPEGLAFEAIMNECILNKRVVGEDHYFLNLSDGEPCYTFAAANGLGFSYTEQPAALHTKRQMQIIRSYGIKILSYFIKDKHEYSSPHPLGLNTGEHLLRQFQTMYGKDAKNINVTEIGSISKTMNGLFLKKE
jgi:hypothetical protein